MTTSLPPRTQPRPPAVTALLHAARRAQRLARDNPDKARTDPQVVALFHALRAPAHNNVTAPVQDRANGADPGPQNTNRSGPVQNKGEQP